MKSDLELKKEYSAVIDYLTENSILFDRVASLGRPVFLDDPNVTAFVSLPSNTDSELEDKRLIYAFGIQFWNSIDEYTRQFVAAHEFLHLFLMHWQRLSDIKLENPKIKKYLPIAVDIPINDMLFDYFGFIRDWVSIDYCSVRTCFKPEDIRKYEIREHQDIKYYLELLIKLGSDVPSSVDQHTSDQIGSNNKSNSEEQSESGESGAGESGNESKDQNSESGSKDSDTGSDDASDDSSGSEADNPSNSGSISNKTNTAGDAESKKSKNSENSENSNQPVKSNKTSSENSTSSDKNNEAKPELPRSYSEKSKDFSSLYENVKNLLEKMETQDLSTIAELMKDHPEYEGSGSSKFGVGTVVTSVTRTKEANVKRAFKDTTSFWLRIVRDKTKIGLSRDDVNCYGFSRVERSFYDLASDGSVFPPSYSERVKLTPKPLVLFCFDYSGSCVKYFSLFEKLIDEIPLDKFEVAISLFNTNLFLTGRKGPVYISAGGTRISCIEEFLLLHEDGKASPYFESAIRILKMLKEKTRKIEGQDKECLKIDSAIKSIERFETIKKYPSAVFVISDLDDSSFSNAKIKHPDRWTFLLTGLSHLRNKPEKSDYYLIDMLLRP